ncbi:MAG: MlaD family protein [Lachnospiraceae bacterium]|nr:MlaD family protein [Lachnospiraceae bacterium]
MKKIFRKEVIIGVCVLAALAILFFGINFLKGVNLFKASNYYYASYTNVEGLAVSAPVTLNGFKVGQVRSIEYEYDNPGHVLVEMSLDKQVRVPRGSEAILGSDLLGTASIRLHLASANDMHDVGDKLIGVNQAGMMDAIGNSVMPAVEQILPRIDSLMMSLNALVGDTALRNAVQRLDRITADLSVTTRNLATATANLGPIAKNVNGITANVNTMTEDLTALTAQVKDLPVDTLFADLQATAENLRQLSAQINDPNSSLGMLMNDPALYNNINSAVQSLDSIFVDIKKNPKRYISIKLF